MMEIKNFQKDGLTWKFTLMKPLIGDIWHHLEHMKKIKA